MSVTVNRPAASRPSDRAAIRVVLVDGHRLLAQSLAVVLAGDPAIDVVGVDGSPDHDAARICELEPDVVLLSYFLLSRDGPGLVAALRDLCPRLKVIVLTARHDDETLATCVEAGAVCCIRKDQPPAELIESIKRAHRGEVLFAPELLLRLLNRRRSEAATPRVPRSLQTLAPRELQVLQTLAFGLSTDEAAERLAITPHTVRTHVKHAMSKLDARSKLEAILIALKAGLIKLPD
jgi:DNA-binding NarL/FixJ family response regulator